MKKVLLWAAAFLGLVPALMYGAQQAAPGALKEFTHSITHEGLTLSLVHLNDRTVDVLFQAPTKYAMKVRARKDTLFYVQGTPERQVEIDTAFVAKQEGREIAGTAHNINNFQSGMVGQGQRIDEIIQFQEKIDLSKPIEITNGGGSVRVSFSERALEAIGAR